MNENNRVLIEKFISGVKERYPGLFIGYEYCSETDEYDIWHTNEGLQFEDKDFLKYIGRLMQEIFFDNSFFDFSFGYDYLKAQGILSDNNFPEGFVQVETTFTQGRTTKIDIYNENDDSIKFNKLTLFHGKSSLKKFTVSNIPVSIVNSLAQNIIYNNDPKERLVA